MASSSTSQEKPRLGLRLTPLLACLMCLACLTWAWSADLGRTETPTTPGQLFGQGYRAVQDGRFAQAERVLEQAVAADPLLADYSLYYLAQAQLETGQPVRAKHTWLQLLEEHPTSPWQAHASLALARLAQAEKNWAEAARQADRARSVKTAPESVRHAATLVAAQAREHIGQAHTAYELYQQLRRTAALSSVGHTAKTHAVRLRQASEGLRPTDPAGYIEEMQLLALEADRPALAALSQQFEQQFSLGQLSAKELRATAKIYQAQDRIEDAAAALQTLAERSPHSARALYAWARLLWNTDRDERALVLFERLAEQFPRHKLAAEALYAIGRIHQTHKDDVRASHIYQGLAERFPATTVARDGRWRQGWMAYQRGEFGQAERGFASLVRLAPNSSEAHSALYWQARSLDKQAEHDRAEALYRRLIQDETEGYYALWAEKRLGQAPRPLALGAQPTVNRPALSARLATSYRRSQALSQLGLVDFARRELDRLHQAAPNRPAFRQFFLAEYHRLEDHHRALRLARGLAVGKRRRYDFPLAYWDILQTHAQAQRLDPYLVLALIRQESLFDPQAVSRARAYGLMQLLPSTATKLLQPLPGAELRLADPDRNIALGTRYLRQLLSRYEDNLILGLAGYNAGPDAVEKWRSRFPHAEADEFVEHISYRETRNYVKKVLRNYRTYRRLYEPANTVISLGPQARLTHRKETTWHN